MKTIRVRVHVTGLVQGVFYRDSTRRRARDLGLSGWVRNALDGSVWLEAQGPETHVEQLVQWCREGPVAARVDDVHVAPLSYLDDDTGQFEIRH